MKGQKSGSEPDALFRVQCGRQGIGVHTCDLAIGHSEDRSIERSRLPIAKQVPNTVKQHKRMGEASARVRDGSIASMSGHGESRSLEPQVHCRQQDALVLS